MPNTTAQKVINYGSRELIRMGTPIDASGNIANDATAIGVVTEDAYRPAKATVITAGIFDAEMGYANSGIALSEECRAALIAITFTDAEGVAMKPPVQSVPYGGTAGQVLTKTETGAEWADAPAEIPEEGTAGQVLTKTEEAFEWADLPEEAAAE